MRFYCVNVTIKIDRISESIELLLTRSQLTVYDIIQDTVTPSVVQIILTLTLPGSRCLNHLGQGLLKPSPNVSTIVKKVKGDIMANVTQSVLTWSQLSPQGSALHSVKSQSPVAGQRSVTVRAAWHCSPGNYIINYLLL